jgi:type II secretory pathway component GspD/PulD (secretin)
VWIWLALLSVGSVLPAMGQDSDVRVRPKRLRDYGLPGLDQKVTLDTLDAWQVVELIEFLAKRGGLNNIVIGKGVAGLTTKLKFNEMPVGDALEVVLSVNSLAYEVRDGIITIMSDAEYQTVFGTSFYDNKQVRILDLKYADPARVAKVLEPIKSTIGTIIPDAVTGRLILIDTADRIQEMAAVVRSADIETVARVMPTMTEMFALKYADAEGMQKQVESVISPAGSIRMDTRTRTLIVTDLPHAMAKVREIVTLFDRRPKQVFIEAKVVDVTLSDDFQMGVNWEHVFEGIDPRFALRSVASPGALATPAASLTYKTIVPGGDLSVVLQALKNSGEFKVLSNPQIAVMDGEEATIEVVEDQPYKEVTIEAGSTNITGVTYLFKKVGVQLKVKPRINDDGFISMDISPEVSQITEWYDGLPQEGTPVIRKSLAQTTIMVQDGVTIIIGGMIKNEKSNRQNGVPFLRSIPLLGHLFRTDGDSTVNRETVVFLTPRIISGEEPFLRMTDLEKAPKPLRPVGVANGKELKTIR